MCVCLHIDYRLRKLTVYKFISEKHVLCKGCMQPVVPGVYTLRFCCKC